MRVNTIYPAIQGEGCLTGTPMVIVRFQGCSVGCPWCDTKESWADDKGKEMTPKDIVSEVQSPKMGHRWVLLTGGEPMEQDLREMFELVLSLRSLEYQVALETNGRHLIPPSLFDWVCVSPKEHAHWSAFALADEVKYVISQPKDIPNPFHVKEHIAAGTTICLQPIYGSQEALDLCVKEAQAHGWRLSLQTHKLINQP